MCLTLEAHLVNVFSVDWNVREFLQRSQDSRVKVGKQRVERGAEASGCPGT